MKRRTQNVQLMGALVWLMGGSALAEGAPAVTVVDFETAAVGGLPNGFSTALTGGGGLVYGKKVPVPSLTWGTLRVVVRGSRFSVHLNGTHLFDVEDTTFSDAGKVALWTKADSVTAFDALEIEALSPRGRGEKS